jgi:hypothetical protein
MSLLNRLFSKNLSSDADRNSRRLKRNSSKIRNDPDFQLQVEKLEEKIALAAQAYSMPSDGGVDGGRHVIVLDGNADDLYFRVSQSPDGTVQGEVPRNVESIIFDTDPNFSNPTAIPHDQGRFQDLLITNGVANNLEIPSLNAGANFGFFVDLPTAIEGEVTPSSTASSANAIIPGTLGARGRSLFTFVDEDGTRFTIDFTTRRNQDGNELLDDLLLSTNGGQTWSDTVTASYTRRTIDPGNGNATDADETITITGDFDYSSGVLFFEFDAGANFNVPNIFFTASYASPVIPEGPSTVRLAPGLDLNLGLLVDLPGENSSIEIASPVVNDTVNNLVSLAATSIFVGAPITSDVGFYSLGSTGIAQGTGETNGIAGDWYGGGGGDTEVEQIVLTAPVTAPDIGIVIKDDDQTTLRERGKLFVSSTGALAGTTSVAVEASYTDIILEGDVSGATQSYLFRTRTETAPYQFVTNQGVGFPRGEISGTTVDITLANDQAVGANETLTHLVNLDTDVESLRIAAAGDDSFGINPTGVVVSTIGLVGNEVDGAVESNELRLEPPPIDEAGASLFQWSDKIQPGDIILGNTSGGVVASPVVTAVTPADQLLENRLGPGVISLASPVDLASGSQVSFQSEATFAGNVLAVSNAGQVTVGQSVKVNGVLIGSVRSKLGELDLDNNIFTADDSLVVIDYQPETDVNGDPIGPDPVANDAVTFEALSVVTRAASTGNSNLQVPVSNTLGIAVGMDVTSADQGSVGTVTAIDRIDNIVLVNNPPAAIPGWSVSLAEQLTFSYATAMTQDFDASLAAVNAVSGVTFGMSVSGVDAQGAVVNNTVEPLDLLDSDVADHQEAVLAARLVDLTSDVDFVIDSTLSFQSPTLVVTSDVAGSESVPVDSLVGVANGATVNISIADIPSDIIVLSVNEPDPADPAGVYSLELSESLLSAAVDPADPRFGKGVLVNGSTIGFGRGQENEFFRYGITVNELNALSLDATVSSGGPVSIATGGDLNIDASVRSHGNVSLASSGGSVNGNAWLVTRDGSISVSGGQVNLNGDTQVLASPFDDSITDIQIEATNGGVTLGGNLSAVNRVIVEQRGAGDVDVTGIVFANEVQVFSEGDVSLSSSVNEIDIRAGGNVSVTEVDDALMAIDTGAAGRVTLSAGGVDPVNGDAALKAEVRGTTNIVVSAPRGSVDITSLSTGELVIGEADLLLTGQATEMFAAGNVSIRSGQEPVKVLDAPMAGRGFLSARAVATSEVTGIFRINNPGIVPSTLTPEIDAQGNPLENVDFNEAISVGAVPGFGDADDDLKLRVRDTILLTNQGQKSENGLYQIMSLGGSGTDGWELRRVPAADTTAEFPVNSRIRVLDGDESGSVYRVTGYRDLDTPRPLSVSVSRQRAADELTVNYATDEALVGTFVVQDFNAVDPVTGLPAPILLDQIQGASAGLVVNGVGLEEGDLLLVRQGTVDPVTGVTEPVAGAENWTNEYSLPSNGIYQYLEADAETNTWTLIRREPNRIEEFSPTTIVVSSGRYDTAVTGTTFLLSYDGMGFSELDIAKDTVETSIGSYDPRDTTTFVVTTAGGTNDAAGSLGKMLSLVQANDAKDLTQEPVTQEVKFAYVLGDVRGPTGTIVLRQELPVVNNAIVLDATSSAVVRDSSVSDPDAAGPVPIVIDGSRVTSSRGGTFVTDKMIVNGLEYGVDSGTTLLVNGIPIPEEATRGEVRGLSLAGFDQGGAVVVNGASNLLVEGMQVGRDANGDLQASKYGIQVTGNSGKDGPVTLLRNKVYGSTLISGDPTNPLEGAGIQIDGDAQGVQVVGGEFGGQVTTVLNDIVSGSNFVGVVVDSQNNDSTRKNSIGVNPMPTDYSIALDTTANSATLDVSDVWEDIGADLYLGQTVSGTGIASGSEIIYINEDAATDTYEVILSDRMDQTAAGSLISFNSGEDRIKITENFYGVDLRSGNVRVTNADIHANVISGIRVGVDTSEDADGDGVDDVQNALWAQIGAGIALDDTGVPDPTVRSLASNAIYGPGADQNERQRYGIQFRESITGMTVSNGNVTDIKIQGNYIGTNTSAATGLENGRFDYWWDASQTGMNDKPPVDPAAGIVDAAFESLLEAPDSDSPAEDDYGNLSAGLAGEDGLGDDGGSGSDLGGNDGIVHTPIRR